MSITVFSSTRRVGFYAPMNNTDQYKSYHRAMKREMEIASLSRKNASVYR